MLIFLLPDSKFAFVTAQNAPHKFWTDQYVAMMQNKRARTGQSDGDSRLNIKRLSGPRLTENEGIAKRERVSAARFELASDIRGRIRERRYNLNDSERTTEVQYADSARQKLTQVCRLLHWLIYHKSLDLQTRRPSAVVVMVFVW